MKMFGKTTAELNNNFVQALAASSYSKVGRNGPTSVTFAGVECCEVVFGNVYILLASF